MMGHRERIWAIAGLAVVGGVVACVGGSGGPFDLEAWEPAARTHEGAPSSIEGVSPTTERAPQTQEPSTPTAEPAPGTQTGRPGGGGGGGLDCSGTYECREPDGDTDTVTLSERNGQCTAQGAIVHPDGRITLGGRQVGTWVATATGFTFTTDDGTVTCTRRGSGGSGGTDGSQPPSPPPSTTGEPPGSGSPPGTGESPPPANTGSPPDVPPDAG